MSRVSYNQKGYYQHYMSSRALKAYKKGFQPRKKWTKNEILSELKYVIGDKNRHGVTLDDFALLDEGSLFKLCCEWKGWHHIGTYAKKTQFFGLKSPGFLRNLFIWDITQYLCTYSFTDEVYECEGRCLHRIKAEKDFIMKNGAEIHKGDLGGFVESEVNLEKYCNAWVADNAKVYGNANVKDDALVADSSVVSGNAQIFCEACVSGNAIVCDDAKVVGSACVSGNGVVLSDRATVASKACISGSATLCDDIKVWGHATVRDNAYISGYCKVYDHASVGGWAKLFDNACVCDSAKVEGFARIKDSAVVSGSTIVKGSAEISGGVCIDKGVFKYGKKSN